jgi:hypothetical protein
MAELAAGVKTIFFASTPWTNLHPFGYWLVTFETSKYNWENSAVSLNEDLTPNSAPVVFFLLCPFQGSLVGPWHGLKHCRQHFSGICKTLFGIDGQRFSDKSCKGQIGSFP